MSDQMEYYKDDLEQLKKRVDNCSSDTLDSIQFFLREANAHMAGISDDIDAKINDEIGRFKKDCKCKSSLAKKFEDMRAEEFISSGFKR